MFSKGNDNRIAETILYLYFLSRPRTAANVLLSLRMIAKHESYQLIDTIRGCF